MKEKRSELERLAESYLQLAKQVVEKAFSPEGDYDYPRVKRAAVIAQMRKEEVMAELERVAREYGGCMSCRHSQPYPEFLSFTARTCRLGGHRGSCSNYEPLL